MACIVHVVAKSWTRLSDFHYCMPGIVLSALYLFMYFFYHLSFFLGVFIMSLFFFNVTVFFFFFMEANYFTILYWFCHTSTWIRHGCTYVPHPEPPSHLPARTIPLVHVSAPAPSILYPVLNQDYRFISYMILYMFQCHYPKSSHPLPLPESKRLFYTYVSLLLSRIQGYDLSFLNVEL